MQFKSITPPMGDKFQEHEQFMLHQYRQEHPAASPAPSDPHAPIDWQKLHGLIPWLAVLVAWIMWGMFLLIPTLFGLHYAGMFPAISNASYVAMGLTLCLAAVRASKAEHGLHAIAFTFGVLLLSYWF